jgi:hypothetical protein
MRGTISPRCFLILACLMLAVGPSGVGLARLQEEQPTPRIEFQDIGFQLPGPDWLREGRPPEVQSASRLVRFTRTESLHTLSFTAVSAVAPGPLSRSEFAAKAFEQERQRPGPEEGRLEYSAPEERIVADRAYPVMRWHFTQPSGTPVGDGVILLYFSSDFEERQRLHVLLWSDLHSAETPAKPLDEFDAVVASVTVRPVGTVLLSDDFGDPSVGVLPATAPDADGYPRGYVDGEYMLQKVGPEGDRASAAQTDQAFADLAVAVDVRFASATRDQYTELACRRVTAPEGSSGYFLVVNPDRRRFRLIRRDKGTIHQLAEQAASEIKSGGTTNRLELTCAGTRIAASINGAPVAAVRDGTYVEGKVAIEVGAPSGSTAEARFDNLLVVRK